MGSPYSHISDNVLLNMADHSWASLNKWRRSVEDARERWEAATSMVEYWENELNLQYVELDERGMAPNG